MIAATEPRAAMAEEPRLDILVVGGGAEVLAWICEVAADVPYAHWSIHHEDDVTASMISISQNAIDLIVLPLSGGDSASEWSTLRQLRDWAPQLPVICLADEATEDEALRFVNGGASDFCCWRADAHRLFARMLRFAVARGRFQQSLDERRDHAVREREISGLNAISGPPPLPVSGRSFGVLPLVDRKPDEFADFVAQYRALLDLALEERGIKVESRLSEELNALAHRLGLYGAGPRDVIDLHKSAMTGCLDGQTLRKARAYVEVARLVLLQIMGFLASFYRHLSWGTVGAPRSRLARDKNKVATGATTTRKDST